MLSYHVEVKDAEGWREIGSGPDPMRAYVSAMLDAEAAGDRVSQLPCRVVERFEIRLGGNVTRCEMVFVEVAAQA